MMPTRRQLLERAALLAALPLMRAEPATGTAAANARAIPSSGENISVVGMGTSRTFDVRGSAAEREALTEVLQLFFDNGGRLIDTSPMYGNAERMLGELLSGVRDTSRLFAATKIWADGREAGIEQMRQSSDLMKIPRLDLIQIHNLRDWRVHVETLKHWKAEGKIRYFGITTSHGRDHEALAAALKAELFDFVQFSYSIDDREAERELLPLAADRGIATLINRPFQRGDLFGKVRGKPLPEWASEFDCASWGQFFLKFCLSHPAVTCLIPATSKPHHMVDNMGAGFGRVPDRTQRQRMIEFIASL
jgi:aryl-alcohol dehydrogenase-like predicted oxidoreductase